MEKSAIDGGKTITVSFAAGALAHLFVRDDFQRPAAAPRSERRRLFDGVTPVIGLIFLPLDPEEAEPIWIFPL